MGGVSKDAICIVPNHQTTDDYTPHKAPSYGLLMFNILISILSSIDSLFRCITTLQCDFTRRMLQAGNETRLASCQSNILTQSHRHSQCKRREFLCITINIYAVGKLESSIFEKTYYISAYVETDKFLN